jgi:hypothetical protein
MRRLDKSTAVSPRCWKGGRPQRARHMSAVRSGTEMSPCPRGYRSSARDASHCHDAVVVSGVVVRGSGSLGSPAARRKQPSPLATRRGRRAPHWSGFTASPGFSLQSPARSSLPLSSVTYRSSLIASPPKAMGLAPQRHAHHFLCFPLSSMLTYPPFNVHSHCTHTFTP